MLFFLYGEDAYSSSEKLKQIRDKFVRDIDKSGYNVVILDEKITIEKLAKELSQSGFLVSKKLVIVKNLLQNQITKDLSSYIIEYISSLDAKDETNILVFYEDENLSSKGAPTGEKLKVFNVLKSSKYSQEFKKMSNEKIISWIISKFKENNKKIDAKLADMLIAKSGDNLWILENEINKISNYENSENISKESIEILASSALNDDIFLFCEKIADKKKNEALKLLSHQLQLGVSPMYILSMIMRQFKILLQIKSAIDEKVPLGNLPKYLSLHPYVVKKSQATAQKYSLDELKNIYKKLLKLDKDAKSSKLDFSTLMGIFILDI